LGEIVIAQVNPQNLQAIWPFLRRGIDDIKARVESDFIAEDVYWWLRQNAAQAYLVSRGTRRLGFFVNYIQARPFSGIKEVMLWLAWAIPLAEREPDDHVMAAVRESVRFMHDQKVREGCDRIVALSSRRGFQRYGFQQTISTWVCR
jgi:hypothetical protein